MYVRLTIDYHTQHKWLEHKATFLANAAAMQLPAARQAVGMPESKLALYGLSTLSEALLLKLPAAPQAVGVPESKLALFLLLTPP